MSDSLFEPDVLAFTVLSALLLWHSVVQVRRWMRHRRRQRMGWSNYYRD